MSDSIGRITVPTPTNSGLTFPFTSDFGYGTTRPFQTISHRFGDLATKATQTFQTGVGPRKFAFRRAVLKKSNVDTLKAFFDAVQGSFQTFAYNAPNADQSTTAYEVIFEQQPLSFNELSNACQVGFNFVECPTTASAPTYSITQTVTRFPDGTLQTALASDVQQIIPLIHIRVRESAVPDIYLSDRRVTVGGQLYLPRVLGIGDPNSDVLMTQNINGQSDNVSLQFGNADRAMTMLANDTDLKYASIDICFYHVQSGYLLQLWKGYIQQYQSDGTGVFPVQCSDGLFQITQQFPPRTVSRTCWKTFNDGVNCPFATAGALDTTDYPNASATSCDYYFDSANGCLAHGMETYFGGHPAQPQGVQIKDNSTGFIGIDRSTVTAVSIISDTVFGQPLPVIFCNDDGNPLYAFTAAALMLDYRDESDFADTIGIVGEGPLGAYTVDDPAPMSGAEGGLVVTNADGYKYIVAPLTDGFPCHGFKVDGNLNLQQASTALGLRQVHGTDPAGSGTDSSAGNPPGSFSLGQGTPQVWESNTFAAGTSFVEIRISKPSQVQPSTPDQHSMTVPISKGLSGRVWDANGNASWVDGLTNPFWVAVNCYLRAIGLTPQAGDSGGKIADQLASFDLGSVVGQTTGSTLTLTVREADPEASTIDFWTLNDVSQLNVGQLVTITGNSGTGMNVTNAPIRGIFPGGGLTGNLIELDVTPAGGSTFGTGGTATVALTSGNGTAQIADLWVAPVVEDIAGDTSERQFRFQGRMATQKPFRDWLKEIVDTGLGYFTWEFGKLKLGIRINASATAVFTYGNMLYQSLKLNPIEAAYEHLILDFADRDYQYQANTAEYQDKDHAAYFNRQNAPLTARKHKVGVGNLSQAVRLAATETREEIGGVNAVEWRNARTATWKTTVLALSTEVGQVIAINHPDVPLQNTVVNVSGTTVTYVAGDVFSDSLVGATVMVGSTEVYVMAINTAGTQLTIDTSMSTATNVAFKTIDAKFRITSWKLFKDWSIELTGKTVCESMYDLDIGPKPADALSKPLPVLFYPQPQGEWAPYQLQAGSSDALYPNEWTFDVVPTSVQNADGSSTVTLSITGVLPVNEFIPNCGAVGATTGSVVMATTGGHLEGGKTYRAMVCARDSNGNCSPASKVVIIQTPTGTSTNSFTINDILWPKVVGLVDYVIFISDVDDLIHAEPGNTATGTLTSGYAWTPREAVANSDAIETWDSYRWVPGTYSGTANWPGSCNVVNQAALYALKTGPVQPALVQSTSNASTLVGGGFTTWTIPFTSNNKAGNALVVDVTFNCPSRFGTTASCTDSQGNTYSNIFYNFTAGSADFLASWIAPNCTAGTNTITITATGAFPFNAIAVAIHEYSGIVTSSPVDGSVAFNSGAHTNTISLSTTTTTTDLLRYVTATCSACTGVTVTSPVSGDDTTYTPTSISFTGALQRDTWRVPDPNIQKVRIKTKTLWHGGVLGAQVTNVSGSLVQANWAIDVSSTDNWTGRILTIIGRNGQSTPFQSYNITAFAPTTGTFTLDRSASAVQVGDVFVVSFKGYDNSSDPYEFIDAGISNVGNFDFTTHASTPHSGLTPHASWEKGNVARVVAGTNRGQTAKIIDNSATGYTFDQPFPIDATSVVIIEAASWDYTSDSATVTNALWSNPSTITVPISNMQGFKAAISLLVGAFTVDENGNESEDGDGCVRMVYIFGANGSRTVFANTTQLSDDGTILVDTTSGNVSVQLLSTVLVANADLLIKKISADSNTVSILPGSGDSFDGNSSWTLFSNGESFGVKATQ